MVFVLFMQHQVGLKKEEDRNKEIFWIILRITVKDESYPQTGESCELFVAFRADEVALAVHCLVKHQVFFVIERNRTLVASENTVHELSD